MVYFRYDVSVMTSLLLISIVDLNYLYLLIVVFIVMVKAFIINYEAYYVTAPTNHTHMPQWSSLQW